MERTIRVTGKGKLAVKPDLIELTLSIKDIKKEYDELLKRSSSATNEVKELLEKIGFERKNIKTKSFDINIEYDSYRDKNDKWVEEFKGYSFIHKMKIAAKEASETEYWLMLCNESPHLPECILLLEKIESIQKVISKIIATTKKSI